MNKNALLGLLLCSFAHLAVAIPPDPAAPAAADELSQLREKMDASKAGIDREKLPGATNYRGVCQNCHQGQAPKAPSRTFL